MATDQLTLFSERAAVLWRNGVLSPADASRAVRQIAEGATC